MLEVGYRVDALPSSIRTTIVAIACQPKRPRGSEGPGSTSRDEATPPSAHELRLSKQIEVLTKLVADRLGGAAATEVEAATDTEAEADAE